MKIYTKTGDKGETSLIGGTRVPKHHLRIESYGTVDELNAFIGLVSGRTTDTAVKTVLNGIQAQLFIVGASLAADPERSKMKLPELNVSAVESLEAGIDTMTAALPELRHFILPGGNDLTGFCHVARCVCRRAERVAVHLSELSYVDPVVITYLNRLSDYLFVLSRKLAADNDIAENQWIP